jgi:hypothetical protein
MDIMAILLCGRFVVMKSIDLYAMSATSQAWD